MLGGRDDVRLRCIDDHHAPLGGGGDVDVVESDPGASDDHQVGRGREELGVDLGRRADDQRVRHRAPPTKFLGRQPELHVDLVAGLTESIETALGDRFGDENSCHAHMPIAGSGPNPTD